MTGLEKVFYSGFVRRWHTNPHLAHTVDTVDAHSARVAKLLITLWPSSSRNAIMYAITHDAGEYRTGDIPATFSKSAEIVKAEKAARTELWNVAVTTQEMLRIKFVDKLDAYMWVRHHEPACLLDAYWTAQVDKLRIFARDLEVVDAVPYLFKKLSLRERLAATLRKMFAV